MVNFQSAPTNLESKGIVVDSSGKDVRRVSFAGHDPDLFFNREAEIFPLSLSAHLPTQTALIGETAEEGYSPITVEDSAHEPLPHITLENAAEYLPLDGEQNREEWLRVGAALHHQFNGSDEALTIFDTWSQSVREYKGYADVARTWSSFGKRKTGPVITFRSILQAYYKRLDCQNISGDWGTPVEINVKLKPVNQFDFELLPNTLRPWVSDIAYRMQCPSDYVAVSVMVALSAVVGKKGLITPKAKDDWKVCPNLWGVNVGRPSAMKTPAASEALKPLQRLEIAAKDAFDRALAVDEAQSFINREGRVLAEKRAKTLIKDGKADAAKKALMAHPEATDKPTRARYIVNDPTIEKLGELLNENPNGLLLYRDELSGFLKTIDREDHSNDRAFYVESFDGKGTYTFDRIGRDTIDIESVCVAMLGNIQPGVLRPYLSQAINGGASDDGMIQRFQLMVWPDLGDWQHIDKWPDKTAKDAAFEVFTRLAEWEGFQEPARFSDEAQKLFDVWFCDLHGELRGDGITPVMESHYGKYKSLIPSLAVLIHLADNPQHGAVVGVDSVRSAIAWGVYLKSHAERVYSSALDPVDLHAKTILSKIESGRLKPGFGTRDIKQGGWAGLDSLDAIKAAITRLLEYGWLRLIPDKPISVSGRPSIRYEIHPKIL